MLLSPSGAAARAAPKRQLAVQPVPLLARAVQRHDQPAALATTRARHWRLSTRRGVVHVWQPPGYRPADAGIVLYAHGYNSTADRSWREFRLAAQFRASNRNALFIVADTARRRGQRPRWPVLDELLHVVADATGVTLPAAGPIVAAAHSAGFNSLARWAGHPRLTEMILLDALYGRERDFAAWLMRSATHRLRLVAHDTRPRAERWVRRVPGALRRTRVPATPRAISAHERDAPLLYFRSQYEHSQMLRVQTVLPLLLALTCLPPALDPGHHSSDGRVAARY